MAKTRTLGPGSLKIGASGSEQDFSADVINTALEPSTDTEDNDNFLDGHTEGGSLPFEWVPNLEGSVKLTGNVVIASIQFGGDVKTKNSNDFSFVAIDVKAVDYTPSSHS